MDFSKYDRDKDGIVDHLFVIHAGNDEASSKVIDEVNYVYDIWSILTPDVNLIVDGVRVDTAIVVAEEPDFDKPHLGYILPRIFPRLWWLQMFMVQTSQMHVTINGD